MSFQFPPVSYCTHPGAIHFLGSIYSVQRHLYFFMCTNINIQNSRSMLSSYLIKKASYFAYHTCNYTLLKEINTFIQYVFKIDNNQKCFLSIKSSNQNDF